MLHWIVLYPGSSQYQQLTGLAVIGYQHLLIVTIRLTYSPLPLLSENGLTEQQSTAKISTNLSMSA